MLHCCNNEYFDIENESHDPMCKVKGIANTDGPRENDHQLCSSPAISSFFLLIVLVLRPTIILQFLAAASHCTLPVQHQTADRQM